MLYVARCYRHIDLLLLILVMTVIVIILIKFSIIYEEKLYSINQVKSMKIVGIINDASVRIDGFVLVPGTDYIYIPQYAYYEKGKMRTTFSYRKCKREMMLDRERRGTI